MATLQQLASAYCSSDEEESERSEDLPAKKRKLGDEKNTTAAERSEDSDVSRGSSTTPTKREDVLPLPTSIVQMFKDEEEEVTEDPSEHEGRIRSFPHLPGNWATHIYIPVKTCEEVQDMVMEMLDSLADCTPRMHLFPLSELHLSLSRTVPIRHYWIQPIIQQLQAGFCSKRKFLLSLGAPEIYINDLKTRSFLGIKVSSFHDEIEDLVRIVDSVFREFGLEEFYENPSFHTSVSWCLGDIKSQLSDDAVARLQDIFHKNIESHSSMSVLEVKEIHCKTGNKLFKFPLR